MYTFCMKDVFRWGFLVKAEGCVLGKGGSHPSSRVGWEGGDIFPLTKSCPWVVTLLDMERNCTTVCGQGLSFLTLPVTLLVADLWNSLLQGSTDTKCLVILQEKPDLFPWWDLSELHWIWPNKKISSKLTNAFVLQGKGISTSWSGSGTWS